MNNEFEITVTPKSSKSGISIDGENIKVYLNSPPADGKANAELLKLFSKELHISKSRIKIVKGDKNRKKKLEVDNFTKKEIIKMLSS
jgi:uncharacterized protein